MLVAKIDGDDRAPHDNPRSEPWCRREGNNRICLCCNRNTKYAPLSCASPGHRRCFEAVQARNRSYWERHKKRLLRANRRYLETHPKAKEWQRQYSRAWYIKNWDRKRAQNQAWEERNKGTRQGYLRRKAREWYHGHLARARANYKRYYRENKAKKNAQRNQLMKQARAQDPGIRARYNLRVRLANLLRLRGPKKFSISKEVILYTAEQLRRHLEAQFAPWMSWSNYAVLWEIDHIEPCSHYDLTDVAQARACFALKNLRPLAITTNRSRYYRCN